MISFSRSNNKYGCFSNFYKRDIVFDGLTYTSSEAAWQAQKTLDLKERELFTKETPSQSKKHGRRVRLRPDWEDVKYDLMVDVLTAKFSQNEDLKLKLLSTGDEVILEDTTGWHDNIWGSCSCDKCRGIDGKNLLGKALMQVRDNFRNK